MATDMAFDNKAIRFCIYCPKSELKLSAEQSKFCKKCRGTKKWFKIPKESTAEDIERTYKNEMICCFNCGFALTKDDGSIMCIDGCGVLDIEEGKCSYYITFGAAPTSIACHIQSAAMQ